MTEKSAIEKYLFAKSENTNRVYRYILKEFFAFSNKNLIELTEADALDYFSFIKNKTGQASRYSRNNKASNSTIFTKIIVLSSICSFLVRLKISDRNPFEILLAQLPKKFSKGNQKRKTEMVEFEKVSELLGSQSKYTKTGIRNLAILAVLFGGGLRRGELLNLKISDVITTKFGLSLYLRETKNGEDVEQLLPEWASEHLKKYLSVRSKEGGRSADFIFIQYRSGEFALNKKIPEKTFYRIFKKMCEAVGLTNISPHSARATAITKLLAEGVPHRDVQEFSRHSSIQMVENYDRRIPRQSDFLHKLSFIELSYNLIN